MAKSSKGPNLNMFGGLVILGVLVIGVLVTNSQLNKQQNVQQEAAGKPVPTSSSASITNVESNIQLGKVLHFNYTLPKGVKESPTGSGTQARIQVMCTQPVPFDYTDSNGVTHTQTDPTVYGEAGNAIDMKAGSAGLLLGGGGSVWLWHDGQANCVATLYQWLYTGGQQTFNPFATFSFTANGKSK